MTCVAQRQTGALVLGVLLLALSYAPSAIALPGDLDSTFSADGIVLTDGGRGDEVANGVARQVDGKLLVTGQGALDDFIVARYTDAGVLDTTFGSGGVVRVPFSGAQTGAGQDVQIQPDGKIVALGTTTASAGTGKFAVVRLDTAGVADTSFSGDGIQTVSFPEQAATGSAQASALALQGDGAIVLAGSTDVDSDGSTGYGVARLTSTGALDSSFSGDGTIAVRFGDANYRDEAEDVALQSDGKIVVAGTTDVGTLGLVRLSTSGGLDATFSGDGRATSSDSGALAAALAIQADGAIVVGGTRDEDLLAERFTAAGVPDTSYSGDGVVSVDLGSDDRVSDLVLQGDGKALLVGRRDGAPRMIAVTRLTIAGAVDPSFSSDGTQTTMLAGESAANAVLIDPSASVTAAGYARLGQTGEDLALARYTSSGTPDAEFGTDGVATTNLGAGGNDGGGFDGGAAVTPLSGGRLLVTTTIGERGGAARYLADGTLDMTYASGGILATPLSRTPAAAASDGGIVVAGQPVTTFGAPELRRYTPGGSPDAAFGIGGVALMGLPDDYSTSRVAVTSDGKVIAAGTSDGGLFAARYLPNGSPDPSFSADGVVAASIPDYSHPQVQAVALQENGKVLVGAYGNGMRVLRFNTNGTLDSTFATNGVANVGGQFTGAIALDSSGRIVVAGSAAGVGYNDSAVARLTPRGVLDQTFAGDGLTSLDLGANDYLGALTILPDDRIVVAGTMGGSLDGAPTSPGGPRPTLTRFAVNGALDSSFSGDGRVAVDPGASSSFSALGLLPDGELGAAGVIDPTDRYRGAADLLVARFEAGGTSPGDITRPDTNVLSGPSGSTDDATPTFVFEASEATTFECRIDSAEFASCSSPYTTSGLAVGAHSFGVRAIDTSGNVDGSPATRSFTVTGSPTPTDTTAPAITITKPAAGQHFVKDAAVTAVFSCRDGGSGVASCTGPSTVDTRTAGAHTVIVNATDVAGNSATKTVNYVVDARPNTTVLPITTPPPPPIRMPPQPTVDTTTAVATLTGAAQKLRKTVAVSISCTDEDCTATTGASVRVPAVGATRAKTYTLKTVRTAIAKGQKIKIKLRLSAPARRAIKRALGGRKRVFVAVNLTVIDAAGNKRMLTRRVRLKR